MTQIQNDNIFAYTMNCRRLTYCELTVACAFLFAPSLLRAQDSTRLFAVVRQNRIGANDGGPSELRGFPRPVRATNGDVYVLGACEALRFDQNGRFIARVGRCGDGPGEFRSIGAGGFLGDSLWLSDRSHRRVTIFGRGQKDPKTLPRSHPSGNPEIAAVLARAMLRGGLAIAEGELIWMQRTDGPSSKASVMSPVVRMRRNGTIVDTLAMLLARSASDMTLTVRRKPFGVMRQPFNIQSYWAARSDGGGIVVVEVPKEPAECPLQCTIRVFDANGRQTMTRRYSPAPTVITKRMVDSAVSALATRITPRDSSAANEILRGELVASIRAQILVPKYEAPVTHLLFGNDGSIWIRGPDHTVGGPTWTIFESSGRQVGRMRIPENLHVAYADLERILAVETDDDGIPWIVQLKVVR